MRVLICGFLALIRFYPRGLISFITYNLLFFSYLQSFGRFFCVRYVCFACCSFYLYQVCCVETLESYLWATLTQKHVLLVIFVCSGVVKKEYPIFLFVLAVRFCFCLVFHVVCSCVVEGHVFSCVCVFWFVLDWAMGCLLCLIWHFLCSFFYIPFSSFKK
jgi:hypothetical protein